MILISNIILTIAFAFLTVMSTLHFIHMFQLNSYKMKVQLKWLKDNFVKSRYAVLFYFSIAIVCFMIPFNQPVAKIIYAVIFVLAGLCFLPKKAKKPLVYTPRVIRMLITNAVLMGIAITVYFLTGFIQIFAIYTALIPFVILLANIINKPVELSINRYYINDAKKMIKAMPDLKVVGVTGSYGKTSVKFYLNKLLSAKYNVLITPESYNTTLGVVKTIRTSLNATHEIFICEMGAKDVGHIKEICDIVNPDCGIITSIGPQHLESFKSIERVVQGKFELADAVLRKQGTMFLNYDNEYIRNNKIENKVVSYGLDEANKPQFLASDIRTSRAGSEFKVTIDGETTEFKTKLIGNNNVQNIIGAISVAHTLGVPMKDLQIQVKRLEGVPHRLQLIKGNNALIIDDAYNSNPTGAKSALDTLAQFDGMKVLLTPGMVELGTMQDECNKTFGKQAAEVCDFVILVGKEQTKSIYNGLKEAEYSDENIYVATNLQDALKKAESLKAHGREKIVLLENDLPDNY